MRLNLELILFLALGYCIGYLIHENYGGIAGLAVAITVIFLANIAEKPET
jgi:hypothetical protein